MKSFRSLLLFCAAFFLFLPQVNAVKPGFAQRYGMFVNPTNQEREMTRIKGLEVLLKAFSPETLDYIDLRSPESVCQLAFLECKPLFFGGKELGQKEMILWWSYLRNPEMKAQDSMDRYRQAWLQARGQNWLPSGVLTQGLLEEFLYRQEVSERYGHRPYRDSFVLDPEEITSQRFSDLTELSEILEKLRLQITAFESKGVLNQRDSESLKAFKEDLPAFTEVYQRLEAQKNPLSQVKNLPEPLGKLVLQYDLGEVLGQITYSYASNIPNRRYNLLTGLSEINGKLYQPGEVMDFLAVLGENGWRDYRMSHILVGGRAVDGYGGGLCGSATMVFTPAWQAGLEIVSRSPHSAYYKNLYPESSLGADAAIYRGGKNLKIRNNTLSPILFYAKNDPENKEVTLYIFGNSPYRKVEIEGPIKVGSRQYKWIRKMTLSDGRVVEEPLDTRYGAVY